MKKTFTLLSGLALMASLNTAEAQQQKELRAILDNTIFQTDATTNLSNGKGPVAYVGKLASGDEMRAMFKFPISDSIPANATINTVTVALYAVETGGTAPKLIQLHKLTKGFGEGNSNAAAGSPVGQASQTGDASWNYSEYNTASWTMAGGDYDFTLLGIQTVLQSNNTINWIDQGNSTALKDLVQGWLDNPATNYGLITVGSGPSNGDYVGFASRESTVGQGGNAPKLIVNYTPDPSSVSNLNAENDNVAIYPNPSNSGLVTLSNLKNATTVRLFDIAGRVAFESNLGGANGQTRLDISALGKGLFIVQVENNGLSSNQKLIIH
jgi:hypothetical protein